MKISCRRSDLGLSLLEVVVATAILGMVLFATYAVLFSTSTSSARGQTNTSLDAKGKEFVEFCKKEFYDARFNDTGNTGRIGIHDNGTQVHYHVALGMDDLGFVTFGYVGPQVFTTATTVAGANVDVTADAITLKGVNGFAVRKNLQSWANHSCVIRFEPELVYYEGPTAPTVLHPGTADGSAPQTWKPNPYLGTTSPVSQVKDDPLPTWPLTTTQPKLNLDINRDGDKNDVFVKGRIWMYVMAPYDAGLGLNQIVKHSQVLSDDVILAVAPDGSFRGDVDGVDSQGTLMRKDTLFRYLTDAPSTWGTTDTATTTVYPGNTTAALGVTIWHGLLDDSGKLFHLRKSWERVSFRLTRNF